jgi:hypothetical protein
MFDTTLPRQPRPPRRETEIRHTRRGALLARVTAIAIVLVLVAPLLAAAVANPGAGAIACLLAALVATACALGCLQPALLRRDRI